MCASLPEALGKDRPGRRVRAEGSRGASRPLQGGPPSSGLRVREERAREGNHSSAHRLGPSLMTQDCIRVYRADVRPPSQR